MSDEAHFPAEQSGPQAAARVSRPNGERRRTPDPQLTPGARAKEAQRLITEPVAAPIFTQIITQIITPIVTLARRADFLAANRGRRTAMPGFVLLVRPRGDGDPTIRIGFTVTRKIGNAVVRNRMKRRLRALARSVLPEGGVRGADHVLIGRAGGIERDFAALDQELRKAMAKLAR